MGTSRLPIFQERFKELRGKMTQGQFAEKLGISRPTVGLYESGARIPDAEVLRDIADKCQVSSDYLLGLTNEKTVDLNIQKVCELTGLREDAVEELVLNNSRELPGIRIIDVINFLATDFSFNDDTLCALDRALIMTTAIPENNETVQEAKRYLTESGYTCLAHYEARAFLLDAVANDMRDAFDRMLNEKQKEIANKLQKKRGRRNKEAGDGEHQED